ncbi:MAG: recombinase family protein [Clostridiales Family XIII bacterium]|jgi:DNA invertase Pin-like site-specific DNA recombinase|nr:recombinase family protein [Clostridiales Family XIII bacterium]
MKERVQDARINAVYARQSVDKADSISIESQVEFCRYELKGGEFREYRDKGYSGKNTDRPQFRQLLRDISDGLVARVVVYKLDRISRSILDFTNMMELFRKHDVEFVSSTERFDTSTPMGRAMLNICIVFAQLERETIQTRVTDTFYSRCIRGLRMGGKAPYGYRTEQFTLSGIHTKKLVAQPNEAAQIRRMFEIYADPENSYGDIMRAFAGMGGLGEKTVSPSLLARMLRNPVYVRADLSVFEFFKDGGAVIANEADDFSGTNGCYLYRGRDNNPEGIDDINGQLLVLAPHEGLVSPELWLTCRRKLMNNRTIQSARKPKNTWLAGKIKCGHCGYALLSMANPSDIRYFRCSKRSNSKNCPGCGKLLVEELEIIIYKKMSKKLREFERLEERPAGTLFAEKMRTVSAHMDNWEETDFDGKRFATDVLISKIHATGDKLKIKWNL